MQAPRDLSELLSLEYTQFYAALTMQGQKKICFLATRDDDLSLLEQAGKKDAQKLRLLLGYYAKLEIDFTNQANTEEQKSRFIEILKMAIMAVNASKNADEISNFVRFSKQLSGEEINIFKVCAVRTLLQINPNFKDAYGAFLKINNACERYYFSFMSPQEFLERAAIYTSEKRFSEECRKQMKTNEAASYKEIASWFFLYSTPCAIGLLDFCLIGISDGIIAMSVLLGAGLAFSLFYFAVGCFQEIYNPVMNSMKVVIEKEKTLHFETQDRDSFDINLLSVTINGDKVSNLQNAILLARGETTKAQEPEESELLLTASTYS